MDLRELVQAEFDRRRARNPRFSMRAYARVLGTHHGTLAQLLAGRRRLTSASAERLCARLGLPAEVGAAAALRDGADAVLRALARPGARLESRWLATRLGIPLDDVNRALHHLLWTRRLSMYAPGAWTCTPDRDLR
jgi:hypothetical protein